VVGRDTIKESVCISADPDDHIQFAQRYIDIGFNHLIFHSAGPNQRAFLEGYGRDVLPQLRRILVTDSDRRPSIESPPPVGDFIDEHSP
jgi:coenzyme F420-dependent glucose-6-phosphate dehydrogenase